MRDYLEPMLPVLLLALLLVAPRRRGRSAGGTAKAIALVVIAWGALVILVSKLWPYVMTWMASQTAGAG